jgi:hypothetical protein
MAAPHSSIQALNFQCLPLPEPSDQESEIVHKGADCLNVTNACGPSYLIAAPLACNFYFIRVGGLETQLACYRQLTSPEDSVYTVNQIVRQSTDE